MTDLELQKLRELAHQQFEKCTEARRKADELGSEWCATLREIDKEEARRKLRAELLAEIQAETGVES